MRHHLRVAVVMCLLIYVAGCGSSGPTPAPATATATRSAATAVLSTATPLPTATTSLATTVAPTPPPSADHQGVIAFYSNRDGNAEIYIVNADGSGLRRLTDNRATDQGPAWSPDGARLAFVSDRDGNREIYLMAVRGDDDTSGTELQRLTNDPAYDSHPAWSPDGTRIAFISERDGNREIYVMDIQDALQGSDGSNPRRLTDHPADDMRPAWSPDGKRIAFNSERDGNWEIYVVDVDGDNLRRLTDSPTWEVFPAWSPDGTQIAYRQSAARGWNGDVWVMNVQDALQGADGSGKWRLTNHPGNDENPIWSPDGTQIVFQSDRYADARTAGTDAYNFELLVLDVSGVLQDADGDNLRRLTDSPGGDYWPTWGPSTNGMLPEG